MTFSNDWGRTAAEADQRQAERDADDAEREAALDERARIDAMADDFLTQDQA